MDLVTARAPKDLIVACVSIQLVVVVISKNPIRVIASMADIVSGPAAEQVRAARPIHPIVSRAAADVVVPVVSPEVIVTRIAIEPIIALSASQEVVTRSTAQFVIAEASHDAVIAAITPDRVRRRTSVQSVRSVTTADDGWYVGPVVESVVPAPPMEDDFHHIVWAKRMYIRRSARARRNGYRPRFVTNVDRVVTVSAIYGEHTQGQVQIDRRGQ
jgi:hypothetical protein